VRSDNPCRIRGVAATLLFYDLASTAAMAALAAGPVAAAAGSFQNYLKEQGHVVRRHAEVRARRGALVRQAVDLASSVVAKLPHGAPLEVVREAVLDDTGALRLRVKTRRPWAGAAVDGWVSAVSAKGTELVATTDAHPPPDDPLGRSSDAPHGAAAFRDFVFSELAGPAELCAGSGALDVAGGGGVLSNALALKGVRSNLVDPTAPEDLGKRDREDIKEAGGPLYRIYRRRFSADEPDEEPAAPYKRERGLAYAAAVRDASAVLGYRPCAATCAIVDFACKARRKFAILPCCPYAVDGQACRGLQEFADKLQKKDPAIRRTTVDGSLVLYATFEEGRGGS